MEVFASLLFGFSQVFHGHNLFLVVAGAFFGTWIGMLPGIGPSTGIALLIPFTYAMDSTSAIILLTAIYFGTMYGGAISSILINTPGDASAIMTAIDGNPLARKGRAGAALFVAALASFIGGTLGILGLTFLATPISEFALKFGPAEYFTLMVFALVATASLIEGSLIKGFLSVVIGLVIGTIGVDIQSGSARFAFGNANLLDGISLLTVVIGVFSISEALINLEKMIAGKWEAPGAVGKLLATKAELLRARWPLLRGSVIGFIVGVFPGAGGAVATMFAYSTEKRISRHPEEFGQGAIEGVAAPESANNASVSGALIPLLTLGIPGSSATAVMVGALMMHGIQPGPLLFTEHPDMAWGVISSLYVGNIVLVILNIPLIGIWVRLIRMPALVMNVLILLLALTGGYALHNSIYDVFLVLLFGAFGYVLRKQRFPFAPMILGLVLGHMLEESLRQALTLSGRDWSIFFTRPICVTLLGLSALCIIGPLVASQMREQFRRL